MNVKTAVATAAVLTVTGLAATASAQLVAADSYVIGSDPTAGEYVAGPIRSSSQPSNLTNTGFANGGYGGGTGTAQFQVTAGDLGGVNTDSRGDKVIYGSAPLDNAVRSNARSLVGVPDVSTYYISYNVNRGDNPTAGGNGFALTGFGNAIVPVRGATSGNLEGLFVGFAEDGTAGNFGNLVLRARTTSTQTAEDVVLVNGATTSTFGTTYTVVLKVEANVGGGSADQVTYYLDPTDFSSDAALASSSSLSSTISTFAIGAGGGDAAFARLNYVAQNWDGNVFFDEPRLALSPQSLVIPEPTTLALAGLGGLTLLRRRRA